MTSLSPATGSTLGKTSVTFTGTNFLPGAVVSFGTGKASSVVVSGGGATITALTPAGVYGIVDVTVRNPGGLADTKTQAFTFTTAAAPAITTVSPDNGPGGTHVVITGTGFATSAAAVPANVTVGGQPLLSPVVVGATEIDGVVPNLPVGTYDVGVVNPDGQGAIDSSPGYTYPSDGTAPTTTASATANGSPYTFNTFTNKHVTVTLTATDNSGGSGVKNISYSETGGQTLSQTAVPGSQTTVPITNNGTTTISFFATDLAGNAETPQSVVVKVDSLAPVLTTSATIPSGPYTSGNTTNQHVTVTFSCTDPGTGASGILSLTPSSASTTTSSGTNPVAITVTSAGSGQSVSAICVDNSGNSSSSSFSGIDISTDALVITSSATAGGSPYTAGTWTNKAVTVTFACTPISTLNQVQTLTAPQQVAGPTTNSPVTGTCSDAVGNSAVTTFGTTSSGIDIDLTNPVASASATTTDNASNVVPYAAGTWTNHDVV
ncbi:MAG TPA: IPT/TIG domain-containing protein, partial [Mycobacteriales bacterium]|nr:IPT/TIG domain-containing protein [Mycobacteriales bacterium]